MVLATGHLARDEIFTLVDGARRGGRRADRRDPPRVPLAETSSIADQLALASAAAAARALLHDPAHRQGHLGADLLAASREVGPEHTVLSSDLGQVFNPPVEDGLALMADQLPRRPASASEEVTHDGGDQHATGGRAVSTVSRRISGDRRPLRRLRLARRRRDRGDRRGRRRGRGDRAQLRRARRVGRAVEGGGPDDRERQAPAPRRGRGAPRRTSARLPLPRPRRLPAADRRRRAARRSPT